MVIEFSKVKYRDREGQLLKRFSPQSSLLVKLSNTPELYGSSLILTAEILPFDKLWC